LHITMLAKISLLVLAFLASYCVEAISVNITTVIPPGKFGAGLLSALKYSPSDDLWFAGVQGTNMIHVVDKTGNVKPFYHLGKVANQQAAGPLAILLDRNYRKTKWIYVLIAMRNLTSPKTPGNVLRDQVVRLTNVKGKGKAEKVIWTASEQAFFESGGALEWDSEVPGALLIGNGYHSTHPAVSQDLTTQAGKLIRVIAKNGKYPPSNPHPLGIYAFGCRNPFRFIRDPLNVKNLWLTDPGPDCNDELNFVIKGANYGFGSHMTCVVNATSKAPTNTNQDGPAPITLPTLYWSGAANARPPTATGGAFCNKCGVPALEGMLVLGFFHNGAVEAVQAGGDDRKTLTKMGPIALNFVPVVNVEHGKGGAIYISDASNAVKMLVPA